MPTKLIEHRIQRKLKEDFFNDLLQGMANQLGIKTENLEQWLDRRGLEPTSISGINAEGLFQARSGNRTLTLSINKNGDKNIHFELDDLIIPLDLISLIYTDWGNTDNKMIQSMNKSRYKIISDFKNKSFDKLKAFMNTYHLNLFNNKWTDSEVSQFNKAVLSGNTDTKQMNVFVCEKVSQDLNLSKISNTDLIKLLGLKNSKRSREDLCRQVVKNIVNTGKSQMNQNSQNTEEVNNATN